MPHWLADCTRTVFGTDGHARNVCTAALVVFFLYFDTVNAGTCAFGRIEHGFMGFNGQIGSDGLGIHDDSFL